MSNWLTYSPVSGHGNATITLSASTLTGLQDRIATIVASNSQYGISDSVLITQNTVASSIPLTFDIISGGTIVWKYFNNDNERTISYSKNDGDWVEITSSTAGTPIDVSTGDVIKFKGNNSDCFNNAFQTKGGTLFTVQGNIMSLIDGDRFTTTKILPNGYTFFRLFNNCGGLVSAENLSLPATTLTTGCYAQMFNGCTSLTTAPSILPATTLANYCYQSMFYGCTSLTTAPVLPATTLAEWCCESMFSNCTSLTTAPALPATTLAYGCYDGMFYGCTSLTTAPELPATSLVNACYQSMFYGCTSLTTAPSILPAINLAQSCYIAMFHSCTSLTTAPVLPATTLANGCYSNMFYNCTSLTTAPELPANSLVNDCYSGMFDGCTSLTTAPELPATTLATNCYSGMFSNCTSLTTTPKELPATTLADSCYSNMFYGCTSLIKAPELPATTLNCNCYSYMFQNCTSLNYIKCLATDIDETICYKTTNWLDNVSPTGTFVKAASMNDWTTGISAIPEGWVVQDDSAGDTGNVQLNLSGGPITLGTDCSANFNSPSTAFTINGLGICGLSGDTNIDIFGESTYMFSLVRQEDLSAVTITYDWSHDSITYLNAAVLVLNFDNGTTSKTANISYNNGFSSTVVDLRDYFTPNATSNVNLTINASIV